MREFRIKNKNGRVQYVYVPNNQMNNFKRNYIYNFNTGVYRPRTNKNEGRRR